MFKYYLFMNLYAGGAVVAGARGLSGEHQLWELCTPHNAGLDACVDSVPFYCLM